MWNSSKEGRGYSKTSVNSGICLEVVTPSKSIPTLCPWKRGNSLGSVNSKVGIWAPACSLLIQESWSKCPRLAAPTPNFQNLAAIAILIEDALKLSFGGKPTIFTSHQVKQLLSGRGHLWMSDQRILSYQVMLMENPGLTISPWEVLNPATLLPTPEGSLPFHSCLETLDHWTKPWEGLSENPLTNPMEIWYLDGSSFVLDGKRRAGYTVVSNFENIEAKPLPPGTN